MNKWCINSLSRVKSSCNYHIPFPPVTTAWSLTWMCMNQRSWMRKTASHVSWHKGSCREGSAKRDHQELSPLGTCSLGYCTRRLRMMSYGHHWHSNAGQQGGLLKKGWSLTRCVLGGGGGQLFGKEVSYPSLTFVNFSYVWQQQLCVRVMPLHIECDSVINDGLANYSWRIQTMQYHLGKHGEKRRGKFNQSLVTSVAFQWPPACIRAWWSRNVAHKCYPYFDPISIL